MHEGNFTEQIVGAILDQIEISRSPNPVKVKVKVGEMLHLVPESVQMHFQLLTAGTRLEKAELELEEVPVMVRCKECGWEGGVQDHHLLMCNECDSFEVSLLAGDQVVIEEIICQEI